MSVTHVAGPMVGFRKEDIAVQRCALCGEALIACRPSRMAVPDGMDPALTQFAQEHLIEVTEGNPKVYADLGRFSDPAVTLPENFCLSLVEMPQ